MHQSRMISAHSTIPHFMVLRTMILHVKKCVILSCVFFCIQCLSHSDRTMLHMLLGEQTHSSVSEKPRHLEYRNNSIVSQNCNSQGFYDWSEQFFFNSHSNSIYFFWGYLFKIQREIVGLVDLSDYFCKILVPREIFNMLNYFYIQKWILNNKK